MTLFAECRLWGDINEYGIILYVSKIMTTTLEEEGSDSEKIPENNYFKRKYTA